MLRINTYDNPSFRMKNNKAAAQKALEKTAPELKQEIYRGINAFCDATQRKGIKGMVQLNKLVTKDVPDINNPRNVIKENHLFFSMKPDRAQKPTHFEICMPKKEKNYASELKKLLNNCIDYLIN